MKKKSISKKLQLNKSVISKFNAASIKGGSRRGCVGSDNCGATTGTDYCGHNNTDTCDSIQGTCPTMWTCPIT